MPGPSNVKKKRKSQGKAPKEKPAQILAPVDYGLAGSSSTSFDSQDQSGSPGSPLSRSQSPTQPLTPPHPHTLLLSPEKEILLQDDDHEGALTQIQFTPQVPFIHDPGNGPRVRDTRAFLTSKYFSQPPALDIPLCAEFAQEEVLQMLMTVLPEETALILWYNKSRATSRICPACQRLYRLGDILPDHMDDELPQAEKRPSPQLQREQELSGLCSPVCFILASFNYPGAIKSAWGRMEDAMDDATWALLNGPAENNAKSDVGLSLGMLMKMTRLHDLGLAQLCLGVEDGSLDEGGYYDEWEDGAD